MIYKVGDKVRLTKNIDVIESNELPRHLANTIQIIAEMIIMPISNRKIYYIYESIDNERDKRWSVIPKQIVGYAKVTNWKNKIRGETQ